MSSHIGTIRFVFSCEPNRGEVNKCAGAASQHSAFDHSVTAHGSACKGKQSDASIRNHECLGCDTGRKTIIQWEVPEGFFKKFTCCCRKGKRCARFSRFDALAENKTRCIGDTAYLLSLSHTRKCNENARAKQSSRHCKFRFECATALCAMRGRDNHLLHTTHNTKGWGRRWFQVGGFPWSERWDGRRGNSPTRSI